MVNVVVRSGPMSLGVRHLLEPKQADAAMVDLSGPSPQLLVEF
jgi:hypothetical protein